MAALEEKEWTLMFYFASDTILAPEIVSQLKSIKQAGFHPNVNVVAQFDPNVENAETHIFDVNRIKKIQAGGKSRIGYVGYQPDDPFVTTLMSDKLWSDQKDLDGRLIREQVIESVRNNKSYTEKGFRFDPPKPLPFKKEAAKRQEMCSKNSSASSEEPGPRESLQSFLDFCSLNYPARHYMLFILGHGLVVGNDTFLFDEHAEVHSLMLQPLGDVLNKFKGDIKGNNPEAEFELISFHSCSMSSLEVAVELQGIANYMLASQGPSFVGSWPYRQILIRIFNYQDRKERSDPQEVDVKGLLKNIFHYCLYNGYDFLVAGYSGDACLCNLNRVADLKAPLAKLSASLIGGLNLKDTQSQQLLRECILLSHLDSQSYFIENYLDLFDFCFRLQQRIKSANQKKLPAKIEAISKACQKVMEALEKGVEGDDDRLIVRSDFVGPAYQYSHGLSVYFPWSKPLNGKFWPDEYNQYQFVSSFPGGQKSWSAFLASYFEKTMRATRAREFAETHAPGFKKETGQARVRDPKVVNIETKLLEAFSIGVFNDNGQLSGHKPVADSSQGDGCACQSIKNFPQFTRDAQPKRAALKSRGKNPSSQTLLDDPTYESGHMGDFVLDNMIE